MIRKAIFLKVNCSMQVSVLHLTTLCHFPRHVTEEFTISLTHGDCNNDASYQMTNK